MIARVTGADDKISLPDPLELRFHFTLAGDAISRSSRLGLSLALIGAIAGLQVSTDPPNILDAERRVETAH